MPSSATGRTRTAIFALAAASLLAPAARAQHTIAFNPTGAGQLKTIAHWGVDTAWPSADNMRLSLAHMGASEVDVVRVNFYVDEPLDANGELGPNTRARVDAQLAAAAAAGNKPLALAPLLVNPTHASYLSGAGQVNVQQWIQAIEATQRYVNRPVHAVEPFNEPDYWDGQGTPQNLRDILLGLRNSQYFPGAALQGASVLNSDLATFWYDQISGPATQGTLHQLAGSTNSYVNFIQHVRANGDQAYNPELHSLAEAIYGAQYGLQGGIWWGPALLPRGQFVKAVQGRQLGYAESRSRQTAAAVYRSPDGQLYGFAGGFERGGSLTPYRFVSTDGDLYFNGVGPLREFMLPVTQGEDAIVDIDVSPTALPPLDGNRWKIVNRLSGLSLEVVDAGQGDGAGIRIASDVSGLNQRWNVTREPNGYYKLFAAHSGRTAEVADWSLDNGAPVRQWGVGENFLQNWFLEDAGEGYFYIRNAHSTKYLTGGPSGATQFDGNSHALQQWQFVLDNPPRVGTLRAHYKFQNNVLDATGGENGVTSGSPDYASGWAGNGMFFDGVDDYVTLPAGLANSDDITIAAWVRWNGGAAWQRVFDFGDSTTANMFLTPMSADNTMRFAITTGGGAAEQILDTEPIPIGPWVHLAVTLSGNTGLLYVNGAPRVGGRITLDPSDITPALNYIGKSQYADPLFRGFIDDVRVYEYALTADEIAALTYNADFDGDGDVDDADLPRWNQNYGMARNATRAQGDANGDGMVNGTDLLIWQRTRGTAAPNGAPVPEPKTAMHCAWVALLALRGKLPAPSPLRGGLGRG